MTARVLGVDPGLAHSGVAELVYDGHRCVSLTARTETSHPPAVPTDDQTAARMTRMIRAVAPVGDPSTCGSCGYTHNPAPSDLVMVVMEGPALHGRDQHADKNMGYWWRLRSIMTSRGVPVARANPVHLKQWATGKGRPTDAEMKLALDRLWPGVLATDDHQVDAALLAICGAQRLGWFDGVEVDMLRLGKMTWPKLPDTRPVPAVTT